MGDTPEGGLGGTSRTRMKGLVNDLGRAIHLDGFCLLHGQME